MKLSATQILALGAVGLGAVVVYQGAQTAAAAAAAVNPANRDNIFNRGFNATLEAVGVIEPGGSFGSWLYDVFHREYDPNREAEGAGIPGDTT